jgi:hypothetical protein
MKCLKLIFCGLFAAAVLASTSGCVTVDGRVHTTEDGHVIIEGTVNIPTH